MVGDMDNTGSLNAQIIHQLTSAVRSKIAIQVSSYVDGTAFQMLYVFSAFTVSVTDKVVVLFCNFFIPLFVRCRLSSTSL